MEWLTAIRKAIAYMEGEILTVTSPEEVAAHVYISSMYLQRGFHIMTGFTIGEYIRNRRLYLAAMELVNTDTKIIDIAMKYGYETPESFTKAFSRFHGASPSQIRSGQAAPKSFLALTINITVQGGDQMDYKITKMFPLKVIGFQREFTFEEAYTEIPKYWDEICEKYASNVYAGNPPANAYEKALLENCIGEYGICIDDIENGKFRYLIAGKYCGGDVPEGMALYEFPMCEWAVFDCIGAIPEALQNLNTKIFREWLPGNPDYEIAGDANVEWYDCINGEKTDANYHSAIWIPVRRKCNS
ncbi:MAG: AraC family transcriptional regulator [Oscillospiraceae bacterium]|nr:AraC family transcriptional regulator [Oscillospiraceae bacterium]